MARVEQWATIEGLERYSVSSYGRVLNLERGTYLTPGPDRNGYYRVGLSRRNKVFYVYIHRLVAMCFMDDYREGVEVRHKDNDLSNNHIWNLEMGVGCREYQKGVVPWIEYDINTD